MNFSSRKPDDKITVPAIQDFPADAEVTMRLVNGVFWVVPYLSMEHSRDTRFTLISGAKKNDRVELNWTTMRAAVR